MTPWATGIEAVMKRQEGVMPPMPTPEEMAFNNAHEILAITGSFFAVAAFTFLLRCYVRVVMLKVFGIDDYIMAVAMAIAAATFACFKIETDYGLGKHFMVMLMDPVAYTKFAKVLYVHSVIVMAGISTVKISIAFFLLRLSTNRLFHRFLHVIIVFLVLMTIACAMSLIFQCLPVAAAWDYRLRPPPFGTGDAKCYSNAIFRNLGLMNSSFNIVTDVLFATMPIPLIWKLQLNLRTKMSLIAILSLGWFACAAAIIKAVQQFHVLEDPDWTVHDSFNVWNYIEFTVGIMAASLPSLKPLVVSFLETARAITTGRTKNSAYSPTGYKGAGSLGYLKQQEESTKSIALGSIASKTDSSTPRSPYNVKVTTQHTGRHDKEAWEMMQAKNSDESILPLQQQQQQNETQGGQIGQRGIVMTREVRVSR